MTAAPYAVTGPFVAGDLSEGIKSGAIGNLLNLYGPEIVAKTQRLAVEETRLGIPLLIGLDVIHGHRTLFPVPLAEAALFDPGLWAATARAAAREAAGRRRGHDIRADVRCLPRSALGPHRRGTRRRSFCGRGHGGGQGARAFRAKTWTASPPAPSILPPMAR